MTAIKLYLACMLAFMGTHIAVAGAPDSVYLFSYATLKNGAHNGLQFAWSRDKQHWVNVANGYGFIKSDYGRWGSQKRMFDPYLLHGADGLWHLVFSVNDTDNAFACASSADLVHWQPQAYPFLPKGHTFNKPIVTYSSAQKQYNITYLNADKQYYQINSTDNRNYSAPKAVPAVASGNTTVQLNNEAQSGQIHRVAWSVVEKLDHAYQANEYRQNLYSENAGQDGQRFKDLKPFTAKITLHPQRAKTISDMLMGVFFEDLNYAADGGLYAELIQNRDFEYTPSDKEGRDRTWTSTHSWSIKGKGATFNIDSVAPVHANNPHYAVLKVTEPGVALANSGYDGIAVKQGQYYDLSVMGHVLNRKPQKVQARLVDPNGKVLATSVINMGAGKWTPYALALKPDADCAQASLELKPMAAGELALDMVSLFPRNTFKGHKNGLRADLAQTVADIHPRFVRFPGGCVAHGDGLANIYRWKNSIGALESRKPQRNLWGYHQSVGLGYFEYFQFCEDIGAQPVPVLAAGVSCQNSATGGAGQQGGIPMDQMDEYIQDVIDLVEYANGPVTSKWGKLRAQAGHPKPFNLKYVGIGNEDLMSEVFEQRFAMIYKAMQKAHPEITVIGTVGPFSEGSDYEKGWEIADRLKVPMVDEHYYQPPGWFIQNQDFYDSYDRSRSKVYLGEYAAHLPGRPSNIEVALTEALYLTSLERNGDVVSMASYAPLLAKEKHTQWTPDLIYFNNTEVKPTVNYYVQQLYGQNAGDRYLPSSIVLSDQRDAVSKRVATSVVVDSRNKYLIIKMVNLLPVSVRSTLEMPDVSLANTTAAMTVLQGEPTEKGARPVSSSIALNKASEVELPAYSFTVLKMKLK